MGSNHDDPEFPVGNSNRHDVPTEAALEVLKESTRRLERARVATAAYNRLADETPAAGVLQVGATKPGQPTVGSRLGRFHLTSELGRGFSSVVYKAHHAMLDIDVALKVLLDRDLDEKSLGSSASSISTASTIGTSSSSSSSMASACGRCPNSRGR